MPDTTTHRLGLGLFSLPAPPDWRHERLELTEGLFHLPGGRRLAYRLQSFEDPAALAAGGLPAPLEAAGLIRQAGRDSLFDDVVAMKRPGRDASTEALVLASLGRWQDTHVRAAWFSIEVERAPDDPDAVNRLTLEIARIVRAGRFAAVGTPLDRVAPTPGLQLVGAHDAVALCVPAHWRCCYLGDRFVCDLKAPVEAADPTLWIDVDRFWMPAGIDVAAAQESFAASLSASVRGNVVAAPVLERDATGLWFGFAGTFEEDGEPLRNSVIRRVEIGGGTAMLVHFNLVLLERAMHLPESADLLALVEREIRRAVFVADPEQAGADAA